MYQRRSFKYLLLTLIAIFLMMLVGFILDRLGYGAWTLSSWNYLNVNMVQGVLNKFVIHPWYYYLTQSLKMGIPPISIVFVASTIMGWYVYRSSALTWFTFPYFVFHTFLGHKEIRFIYPIIIISPVYLGMLIDKYYKSVINLKEKQIKYLTICSFSVNAVCLILVTFKPASYRIKFYHDIYNMRLKTLYTVTKSPYIKTGLITCFYINPQMRVQKIKKFDFKKTNKISYIYVNKLIDIRYFDNVDSCNLIYSNLPHFIFNYNILSNKRLKRLQKYNIYTC